MVILLCYFLPAYKAAETNFLDRRAGSGNLNRAISGVSA
jgi:hypothetical protein